MRIRLLAVLLTLVGAAAGILFAAKAAASINGDAVQVFYVADQPPNFSNAYLAKTERVIQEQVLQHVRQEWDVPQVVFGTTGVEIQFMPLIDVEEGCGGYDNGCHQEASDGSMTIYVSTGSRRHETHVLDHEILETLVDPDIQTGPATFDNNTLLEEICDPVATLGYWADGVYLADYVAPSYFKQPLT